MCASVGAVVVVEMREAQPSDQDPEGEKGGGATHQKRRSFWWALHVRVDGEVCEEYIVSDSWSRY